MAMSMRGAHRTAPGGRSLRHRRVAPPNRRADTPALLLCGGPRLVEGHGVAVWLAAVRMRRDRRLHRHGSALRDTHHEGVAELDRVVVEGSSLDVQQESRARGELGGREPCYVRLRMIV